MIELTHKRKLDSKVFDTGRLNEKDKSIYGTKIQNGLHDIEPDGSFVECDPSMRDYVGNVSSLEVIRGRYGSLRAGDTGSEAKDRVKILTKNNSGISLKLVGHRTYGPWEDTTRKIRFNTNDGITLNYYPSYKGVNIVITINNPQTASNVIRFSLKEYGCDYTYEEKNGNIIARSSTGKDDIYLNALCATDANGDIGQVSLRLGDVLNGLQIIEKVVSPVWLGNAVGPVDIDPSITIDDDSGTFEDALLALHPTGRTDFNNGVRDSAAKFLASNNKHTTVFKVDLTGLPSSAVVTLARLGIHKYLTGPGSLSLSVHKVLRFWNEGNKFNSLADTGEVTWNSARHSELLWTTPGAKSDGNDRQASPESAFLLPPGVDTDYHISLTSASIQSDIDNPSTNNGYLIEAPTVASTQYVNWYGSETVVGNKPYLYIEYVVGAGGFPFFFDGGHF